MCFSYYLQSCLLYNLNNSSNFSGIKQERKAINLKYPKCVHFRVFGGHICSSNSIETNRNNLLCHFSELILSHLSIVMQWNTHTPLRAHASHKLSNMNILWGDRVTKHDTCWHPAGWWERQQSLNMTGYLQGRWESAGVLDLGLKPGLMWV